MLKTSMSEARKQERSEGMQRSASDKASDKQRKKAAAHAARTHVREEHVARVRTLMAKEETIAHERLQQRQRHEQARSERLAAEAREKNALEEIQTRMLVKGRISEAALQRQMEEKKQVFPRRDLAAAPEVDLVREQAERTLKETLKEVKRSKSTAKLWKRQMLATKISAGFLEDPNRPRPSLEADGLQDGASSRASPAGPASQAAARGGITPDWGQVEESRAAGMEVDGATLTRSFMYRQPEADNAVMKLQAVVRGKQTRKRVRKIRLRLAGYQDRFAKGQDIIQ